MLAVTTPDGILVAVVATHDEAGEVILSDVLKRTADGALGRLDPLFSFVPVGDLTVEQAAELQRLKDGAAEFYGYKVERLTG